MGIAWASIPDSMLLGPAHMVTLDGFEISAYEITNTQYTQYLNEALSAGEIEMMGLDPYGRGGKWYGKRYIDLESAIPSIINSDKDCKLMFNNGSFKVEESGMRNWPVVGITWYGAKAFAVHYDLDLPTEAQWEYAARGGALEYLYATDDGTIDASKANFNSTIGHPIDIGSYPANPFGVYDMSGNVSEWCNNWFSPYPSLPVVNPVGPETGSSRVYRGGTYLMSLTGCSTTKRFYYGPDAKVGNIDAVIPEIGFRVVR
jgi:formylglycine-generating enzyme required for sulfatase activity